MTQPKEFKKNSDFRANEIPDGDYEGIMIGKDVSIRSIDAKFKVIKGIGGKSSCLVRSDNGLIKVYIGNKIFIPEK